MSKKSELEDILAAEFDLYGIPKPIRQWKFHPGREFALDFAWPDHTYRGMIIAGEVNGGLYIRGRHTQGAALELEYEKIREASLRGISVFPFGPKALYVPKREARGSEALRFFYRLFNGHSPLPAPNLNAVLPKPRRGKTMNLFLHG